VWLYSRHQTKNTEVLHDDKEIAEKDREVLESRQAFREFVIKSVSLMREA
jgi:hypothetical protein